MGCANPVTRAKVVCYLSVQSGMSIRVPLYPLNMTLQLYGQRQMATQAANGEVGLANPATLDKAVC